MLDDAVPRVDDTHLGGVAHVLGGQCPQHTLTTAAVSPQDLDEASSELGGEDVVDDRIGRTVDGDQKTGEVAVVDDRLNVGQPAFLLENPNKCHNAERHEADEEEDDHRDQHGDDLSFVPR